MNKNKYLALGGLFCALHLLFVLMAKFLPGSELILVIFLPLLSTIYALKFDKKALAIFLIATFALCVIFEPISTFIYVVPGLICGSLYGILRKLKFKELSLVYISSLGHAIAVSISFLAISLLFKEVNFFEIFSKILGLQGEHLYVAIYLFLLLLGVIEAFIVHIVSNGELKRFGYARVESEEETPRWMIIGFFISLVTYLVLIFASPLVSIYVFPFVLMGIVPILIEFIISGKRKWIYIFVALCGVFSLFLLNYINLLIYPVLLVCLVAPIVVEKLIRILYTFYLKYLNNEKNKIE